VAGDYDLIVIGGGAAGLAAAQTGAAARARTLLVSEGELGGECTFTGCVPSKTLIEAAARGATFPEAMAAVRDAVAAIAATETPEVLNRRGVEVLRGHAAFTSPRQISADGRTLRARSFVLATGSRPALPPLQGLAEVPYLTNENIFGLTRAPGSLVILGGGAVGCELAQPFRRLGSDVTVIEAAPRLLPAAELEASQVVERVFRTERIDVRTGVAAESVKPNGGGVTLILPGGETAAAERLLVATGRQPVTGGLGLESAGVAVDHHGYIVTDKHLATTAPGIYAAGDVTGRMLFTHAAYATGRLAAGNALRGRLGPPGSFRTAAIPWAVFTSPEVAQVGVTEHEAAARKGGRVAYLPMREVDRAVTAGRTEGFIKIIAGPRRGLGNAGGGQVLGATIVAGRAGEMINEVALAIRTGMFTGRLAQAIHAYPTWSLAIQQAAAQFFGSHGGRTARPARMPLRRPGRRTLPARWRCRSGGLDGDDPAQRDGQFGTEPAAEPALLVAGQPPAGLGEMGRQAAQFAACRVSGTAAKRCQQPGCHGDVAATQRAARRDGGYVLPALGGPYQRSDGDDGLHHGGGTQQHRPGGVEHPATLDADSGHRGNRDGPRGQRCGLDPAARLVTEDEPRPERRIGERVRLRAERCLPAGPPGEPAIGQVAGQCDGRKPSPRPAPDRRQVGPQHGHRAGQAQRRPGLQHPEVADRQHPAHYRPPAAAPAGQHREDRMQRGELGQRAGMQPGLLNRPPGRPGREPRPRGRPPPPRAQPGQQLVGRSAAGHAGFSATSKA
jgi:pyruvate/2-oxoglutarate dehydrogenase complex dihydrolipoamide dehydrogenase (E3) component